MEYTHLTRIGNEGDLVKHSVLACFVSEILSNNSDQAFVYAETHTGRAEYRLPDKGSWRLGIGKFSEKLHGRAALTGPDLAQIQDTLAPYIRTCFHSPVRPGYFYPGSSGLVFRMLREVKRKFKFHLWDLDPAVCHSLLGFFENWPEVSICRGDGFDGVSRTERASLVLLDPISIEEEFEQQRLVDVIRLLTQAGTPFICWTPLVKGQEKYYESLKRITCEINWVDTVRWKPEGETRTMGCQITVPKKWGSLTGKIVSVISTTMGWK